MGSLVLTGDTSGSGTINVPAVAGTFTATIGSATGTHYPFTAATAVSASGTSVDFTSIPSWVKRITLMFNAISTNGTSGFLVQIGSGSVTSTGYTSSSTRLGTGVSTNTYTTGFGINEITAASVFSGALTLMNVSSNVWVSQLAAGSTDAAGYVGGGNLTLSGTLDRVRITTVNGTDAFDAGSVNIFYE